MKKTVLFLLPLLTLGACGEEPAPEPTETAVATPEPIETLPAPDQELFSARYAEACPSDAAVNTSVCRRAGMGSPDVICEFGLGDDEYLRNDATLTAQDGGWVLADPENVCVG